MQEHVRLDWGHRIFDPYGNPIQLPMAVDQVDNPGAAPSYVIHYCPFAAPSAAYANGLVFNRATFQIAVDDLTSSCFDPVGRPGPREAEPADARRLPGRTADPGRHRDPVRRLRA